MKKLFTLALLAVMALGANAQDKKDDANKNKPVFTVVKSNPITSIKNQNRSGTCCPSCSTASELSCALLS